MLPVKSFRTTQFFQLFIPISVVRWMAWNGPKTSNNGHFRNIQKARYGNLTKPRKLLLPSKLNTIVLQEVACCYHRNCNDGQVFREEKSRRNREEPLTRSGLAGPRPQQLQVRRNCGRRTHFSLSTVTRRLGAAFKFDRTSKSLQQITKTSGKRGFPGLWNCKHKGPQLHEALSKSRQ